MPHPQPVPACLQSRGASQLAAPAVRAPDALAQCLREDRHGGETLRSIVYCCAFPRPEGHGRCVRSLNVRKNTTMREALQAFLDLKLQTNYDLDDRMLLLGFLKSSRDLTTDMSVNCCTDLQMPRVFLTKTKKKGVVVVIQTSLAIDT